MQRSQGDDTILRPVNKTGGGSAESSSAGAAGSRSPGGDAGVLGTVGEPPVQVHKGLKTDYDPWMGAL
jgi:hypothetical protein